MWAKQQHWQQQNHTPTMFAVEFTSHPRRQGKTRTRVIQLPHRGGPSSGFGLMDTFFQPLGKDCGGRGSTTHTTSPMRFLKTGRRWGGTGVWMPLQHHMLGCGAVPSLERNSDRMSVFVHHYQAAWERLQVWIPRPTKLKEFHIDKNELFP